jgi:L-threonylcarbamoyladenylate synthase
MPPRYAARVDPAELAAAVAALRRGEVVGMPTETVYGLAGDAGNPAALARIYALKGRPAEHPVIVHLGAPEWLERWAQGVPPEVRRLAQRFWPGPLTLILKRRPEVLDAVTGGQDTVGLRMPAHPLALELLNSFGAGLAAPSANRFGHVSPTSAEHVRSEFGDLLPIVLEGGPCEVGIESTIVDLSGAQPRILRPGGIGAAELAAALGRPIASGASSASPRVSGALKSHYAPRAPAELLERPALVARAQELLAAGKRPLLLAIAALPAGLAGEALAPEPRAYARGLYASLRRLDRQQPDRILIERPPATEAWAALLDRLTRATR